MENIDLSEKAKKLKKYLGMIPIREDSNFNIKPMSGTMESHGLLKNNDLKNG